MNQSINLFKLLSDETRLRILNLLQHQKLCVCEFTEILDLSQPKISKHIAKLRTQNLVNTERNEQYIYYSLNPDFPLLNDILASLEKLDITILKNDINTLNSKTSFVCTTGSKL